MHPRPDFNPGANPWRSGRRPFEFRSFSQGQGHHTLRGRGKLGVNQVVFSFTRPLDHPRLSDLSLMGVFYRGFDMGIRRTGNSFFFRPAACLVTGGWTPGIVKTASVESSSWSRCPPLLIVPGFFLLFPFLPGDFWSLVIRFFLKTEALSRSQDFFRKRKKVTSNLYPFFLGNYGCLFLSVLWVSVGLNLPQKKPTSDALDVPAPLGFPLSSVPFQFSLISFPDRTCEPFGPRRSPASEYFVRWCGIHAPIF